MCIDIIIMLTELVGPSFSISECEGKFGSVIYGVFTFYCSNSSGPMCDWDVCQADSLTSY